MGSAPGGPPDDPDEPDRIHRQRDTEPIPPRTPRDDGPGYSEDTAFSPGASYSDGPAYSESAGYADSGRGGYLPPEFSEDELSGLRTDAAGMPIGPRRVLPLEDEPSSLVARYLFPTERYRGEWKRHWVHLTTPLLIGTAATFALGYLSGFLARQDVRGLTTAAVIVWFAVMGWVAWQVGDWYFDRFILTNKRVMVVNGIITRKVGMMPLLRVTDMKYEQSPLGRMLNYGTFVLESAGQDQALREVKHLPNPNELYLRVVEEMYEPQAVEARLGKAEESTAEDGA
ncbi:PH domain-containing protein [Phytohabitans sp. ZYX-F-186]|uniref:PH domain-containing protein n=1 Tax=Phytohabitans maris TaxID=3071409 RepID=A0ABU0ZK92_9ACTN|nr:PH domain-containing protein [Phytohabitans sp. ZYX-F-186]MDQ7906797.1 PH domain-containing protein [Phytohabitans sp. ZYX-F-186]